MTLGHGGEFIGILIHTYKVRLGRRQTPPKRKGKREKGKNRTNNQRSAPKGVFKRERTNRRTRKRPKKKKSVRDYVFHTRHAMRPSSASSLTALLKR
jgi:hypothetical protein